jgi:transcriptional regulator with AAA-type ATPase domain
MLASYFLVLTALGAIAHPVTTEEVPPSYANCTVVRVPIQGNVRELKNLINELALQVWQPIKETSRSGGFVDFVLPQQNKATWDARTTHFSPEVMHRDLGSEIAAEKRSIVSYGMSAIIG